MSFLYNYMLLRITIIKIRATKCNINFAFVCLEATGTVCHNKIISRGALRLNYLNKGREQYE